jgi:hypothetical protein
MIDALLRWAAARVWRRRIERARWTTAGFMEWKRNHPNRCMYCAYTRWANIEQGQKMKIESHHCVEGNGPPQPLPRAKVIV